MAQMRRDIEYLAGNLVHRGASTDSERMAAEYIRDRLSLYTPDTEIDDFHVISSPWLLFAAYYVEFLIVALLAFWQPWFAFAYGAVVSTVYLIEFAGYNVLTHLVPQQYETQNVVARILGDVPKRLFVIIAHYDTPRYSAVTSPRIQPWLRTMHLIVLGCMLAVLVSCVAEALEIVPADGPRYDLIVRWCAVTGLLCAAAALMACEYSGEFTRGASDNASGVAVLLDLAQRFTQNRLPDADVWIVATGSKETWLSGMRRFMKTHRFDKETTYFINIDQVGSGELHYVVGEGLLQTFPSDADLTKAAATVSSRHHATPITWHSLPSDAFIPLLRGYRAISITASGARNAYGDAGDRAGDIDYNTVTSAAAFAEAIVRNV